MTPRFRLGFGLSALALGALAWWAISREALSRTRDQLAAAERRQQAVEQQSRQLEQTLAERRKAEAGRPPVRAKAAAQTGSAQGAKLDPRIRALLASPHLQAQYLAVKKARLGRDYGPLFKSLNLTSDQSQRLLALFMQLEEQKLDLVGAVPSALRISNSGSQWDTSMTSVTVGGPGKDPDVQAANQLMRQADQAFQTAATDLLGPDGYQKLQDYERILPMRTVTDDVAGVLAATPSPLTPEQSDQLTQILAQASANYARGNAANLGQVDWAQAVQQAQGLLSPAQLSAFSQTVALRLAGNRFNALVRTAAAEPSPDPSK